MTDLTLAHSRADDRLTLAAINDAFRRQGPGGDGHWVITASVSAVNPMFAHLAIGRVRAFADFTSDNDPSGEHDFGSFTLGQHRLFWKIDYFDRDLEYGSPDPLDASVTTRVLTVMLASDY